MDRKDQELLIRRISGQLDEAHTRELEQRLAREPGLRQTLERLERTWSRLSEPETEVGQAIDVMPHVMTRVRQEAQDALRWSTAPLWAKAGSAASLLVGISLGLVLTLPGGTTWTETVGSEAVLMDASEPTLVDAYWQVLGSEEPLEEPEDDAS